MEESAKTISKGFKVFLIILIIVILVFMRIENRDGISSMIQKISIREKSLDFISRIDLEGEVDNINLYDDILVKWNKNNLSFLKADGSIFWEKEFNFEQPYIYYGQQYIYAIDKTSGHIYSMDKNGDTVFKAQLNQGIFAVKESNDQLMVHIKDENGENIKIMNHMGDIIKIHEELDNNILYYNLDSQGDKYGISTLNTKGDTLVSQLGIYNFSGEKLQDVEFKNMIILRTEFVKNDILVLTDTSINYIKDGIVKWKRHFPAIKDMYLDGDNILILYDKNFEIIGLDGKTIEKFVFAADYKKIKYMDKIILLYGKGDILGIKGNKEVLNYKLDNEILALYNNQTSIYIRNQRDVEIFKLKTK